MAELSQLGSLDSEKWLDIPGFTDFRPVILVKKCHTVGSSQISYLCRLGRFPVGAVSRTRLSDLYWNILVTWPNHRSWDICIRRSGSTFWALRISQLRSLSRSVTPRTLRKIQSLPLVLEIDKIIATLSLPLPSVGARVLHTWTRLARSQYGSLNGVATQCRRVVQGTPHKQSVLVAKKSRWA